MLIRIAVAGDNTTRCTLKEQAAAGVDIVSLVGDAAPAGTTAIIGGLNDAQAVMQAALALGEEQHQLLELLAQAIDVREGVPMESAARLREQAAKLAGALGMTKDEQLTVERGSLLHDIGKLKVPNDVLLKKSVLDYDEWNLIREHTNLGAQLLSELGLGEDVTDIVRYHHECWDGDGYPEKLERDAIPLAARIMKVADVYCSMTMPRHYRKKHATHEEAMAHIRTERGKHLDPKVVDAFLDTVMAG